MDKFAFLRQLPLMSDLDASELTSVANRTRLIEYKKHETLFLVQDPPENFYILISGRLQVFLPLGDQREFPIRSLYRGDYTGEAALLTDRPYGFSAKAVNDSLVLRIGRQDFHQLVQEIPALALRISRTLGDRLLDREPASGFAEMVALYAVTAGIGKSTLASEMALALQLQTGRRTVLMEICPLPETADATGTVIQRMPVVPIKDLPVDNAIRLQTAVLHTPEGLACLRVSQGKESRQDEQRIPPLLSALAAHYELLLIDLPIRLDTVALKTIAQSDRLLVLTDTRTQSLQKARSLAQQVSSSPTSRAAFPVELVLLQEQHDHTGRAHVERMTGKPVRQVLPKVEGYPATNPGYRKAVYRLARHVGHALNGLALSSGSALGLAHIGVLEVVDNEQLPIDVVSGTSMGALVGAAWASGVPTDELRRVAMHFRRAWNLLQLGDAVFPRRGFLRGNRISRLLQSMLGNTTFEDLDIELRIVSANLHTRQPIVFSSGSLWQAVRASLSIPGIFEPVEIGSVVHVDGAIVHPVPVLAARDSGATRVVAVNAIPSPQDIQQRYEEEQVGLHRLYTRYKNDRWQRWQFQFRHAIRRTLTPNLFDIITGSMQTMQYQLGEIECREADVTLRPSISRVSWIKYFNAHKLIEGGEREARRELPTIRSFFFPRLDE